MLFVRDQSDLIAQHPHFAFAPFAFCLDLGSKRSYVNHRQAATRLSTNSIRCLSAAA
jgi:hypothetical protein